MAKITRKTQKVFGSSAGATGITEYGSPASGTPVYDTDPDNIQTLAWETGWSAAALAGTEIPTFQDFNAIHFVATRQIGYLLQEGIAEYDSGTEYHQNSIVKKTGTVELYASLTNSNTGNALPSRATNANWKYLGAFGEEVVSVYDDSGSANTYELDVTSGLGNPAQYYDGLTVIFKAGNASSGASTIQIGSLAVKDFELPDGTALTDEIVAGDYTIAIYRSGADRFELLELGQDFTVTGLSAVTSLQDADQIAIADSSLSNENRKITIANVKTQLTATTSSVGFVEKATATEVTAETADKFPDAADLKAHNGVAKAWVNIDGTAIPAAANKSYNVSSITDNGTGDYTINFTTAFADADYAFATHSYDFAINATFQLWGPGPNFTQATSSIRFEATNNSGRYDANPLCAIFFGDQ